MASQKFGIMIKKNVGIALIWWIAPCNTCGFCVHVVGIMHAFDLPNHQQSKVTAKIINACDIIQAVLRWTKPTSNNEHENCVLIEAIIKYKVCTLYFNIYTVAIRNYYAMHCGVSVLCGTFSVHAVRNSWSPWNIAGRSCMSTTSVVFIKVLKHVMYKY